MSHKIIFIGETWDGSNSRSAYEALQRLGHSVYVIDEWIYNPAPWNTAILRFFRRVLRPILVRELEKKINSIVAIYGADLLFVFKGKVVHPNIIRSCKKKHIKTINFYPDVSFLSHGPYIPRALPLYDHVFTTKSWGMKDMIEKLGCESVSFLAHGFDPMASIAPELSLRELQLYRCDVVFIGNWSPKKQTLLEALKRKKPDLHLKIWGPRWVEAKSQLLSDSITGFEVTGVEYVKALYGASICLGLLSEAGRGASSGDTITSRTFNIPASGAFLLHERNAEVQSYFSEGIEMDFFGDVEEMAAKISFYLVNPDLRIKIAAAGRQRCLHSDYSLDGVMRKVIARAEAHPPGMSSR